MSLDKRLNIRLSERKAACLYRARATVAINSDGMQTVNGQVLLNFCSNDYLGLSQHQQVIKAMQAAAAVAGVGSGAAHLVSGHGEYHHQLELALARITGRPRALLFSTGYMANLGFITALLGKGEQVLCDKLNHASIVDACQLAAAKNGSKQFLRYRHNDLNHCEDLLKKAPPHSLVVTDGIFSMDGDSAPLRELAALTHQYNAVLSVDDAHGFGVLGENGGGSLQALGLSAEQVPVYMGTLGKAVGGYGAFVAGSEALIETLIQFARPYIYTTALPPSVAAANLAALQIIEQQPSLRQQLHTNIVHFKQVMQPVLESNPSAQLLPSATAIQPVVLGEESRVMKVAAALKTQGFWVGAIRPPTVPTGTARLRITLSAAHSPAQIDALVHALGTIFE